MKFWRKKVADKEIKIKPININLHIKNIEEAELYYKIFNTVTNEIINSDIVTSSAVFSKLVKRLESQGIDPEVEFS